ncbi:cellulase family glycosylhydrolase [Leeuwenhoekiella sp. A16]|uniref:cellulase family glycosylhydrolase n=1 Tax=unclassified Leeuwenhoekiella TaxID=2615029 RepID=UPI003A80D76B
MAKQHLYKALNRKINFLLSFTLLLLFSAHLSAQQADKGDVFVDNNGVMRWGENKEEVHGFGVNYTVPFAHAYRQAKQMGIDPKKAIDDDIYHFSRLGFDLYRIHVWDTEISDTLGNLIENEHLDTFDYLLNELKKKEINYVITPIAFWGNGWPEPDEDTPGFSHKYGKGKSLTDPGAIKAAQNYLEQFLNHVNPYTNVAYKDEPNIIAFEVSNEPHHSGEAKKVTQYIKKMVKAMRKSGTKKPIFYNISHGVHFVDAYFDAGIQGGTFQWYPTGLGYQQELPGNYLPNVNDYNIPFEADIKKHHGAKLVYEFDAADVGRSYIYPAIARSFRKAGIQIATQFAYDPTFLAPYNTEYNTHYMNLAYAPQKALSLMITSKVFHEIPMYTDFGSYPENTTFDNFTVDYNKDLATYNTEDTFIYTNTTSKAPKNASKLAKIAGYGNSPIVDYDGAGAYFLNKISDNTWRLEVMPDAIWVDNPFGKNSLKKTVAVIKWAEHNMSLKLDELGSYLTVEAINDNNSYSPSVDGNSFKIKPGTYIISKTGNAKNWSPEDTFGPNKLKDFVAPKDSVDKPWLKHEAVAETSADSPLKINVQFVSPEKPQQIQLIAQNGMNWTNLDLEEVAPYQYETTIPAEKLETGYLNYRIIVKLADDKFISYPSGENGRPSDWDFYDQDSYKVTVVPKDNPVYLFDAAEDSGKLVSEWRRGFKLVPTENKDEAEYDMNIEKLFVPDNENLNAKPRYDYSFKHFILDVIKGRKADLTSKDSLVFKGRSLNNKPEKIQVAFVLDDGSAYGNMITLQPEVADYKIALKDLKPVKTVTLPRPYPSFLPYYLEHDITEDFDINRVESLQFSIGPGLSQDAQKAAHGIGIIEVSLE